MAMQGCNSKCHSCLRHQYGLLKRGYEMNKRGQLQTRNVRIFLCSLHILKETLVVMPNTPITSIFAGKGYGRRFFTISVRASVARATTTTGRHLNFMLGGG